MADEQKDLYSKFNVTPESEGGGFFDVAKAGGKGALLSGAISGAGKLMQMSPYGQPAVGTVGKFLSAAPVESAIGGAAGGATEELLKQKGAPYPIQLAGGLLAGITPTAVRAGARGLYQSVLGAPTKEAETLLPEAQKIGIHLDPTQLRAEGGRKTSYTGATPEISFANQKAINNEASRVTGKVVDDITDTFIGERMNTVGEEIGNVIKGPKDSPKSYVVSDPSKFNEILQRELDVNNPAYARTSTLISNQILQKAREVDPITGVVIKEAEPISGEVLQRLRSELGRVIRTSTDRSDAYVAAETINAIDSLVSSQLTGAEKQILEKLRPQYRAAATLDLLAKRGGIDNGQVSAERLGRLLRQKDYKYTQGTSTHPLATLGKVGETYNLRSISEAPSIPEKGKVSQAMDLIKKAGLYAAPAVGVATRGATGGLEGLALSMGFKSAEELGKALARSSAARNIQTKFAPQMRQPAKSYISPAGKAVVGTELTRPGEE